MQEKRTFKENWKLLKKEFKNILWQWKTLFLIVLAVLIAFLAGLVGWVFSFIENNAIMIPAIAIDGILFIFLEVVIVDSIKENISSRRNLFSLIWYKSSDISPEKILGEVRSKPSKGFFEDIYFTERSEEQKFWESMEKCLAVKKNGKNVLIRGAPLSGKSRMVYEWLKKQKDLRICLIQKSEGFSDNSINPNQFLIPFIFNRKQRKLLIIDDLHTYTEISNFASIIHQFQKAGISILTTSRTSFEYERIKRKGMDFLDLSDFKEISLDRMDKISNQVVFDKFQQYIIEKRGKGLRDLGFDGTVGSVFLPIEEMRKRYEDLCEKNPMIKNYLSSIKILYSLGINLGEAAFLKEWIQPIFEKGYDVTGVNKSAYDLIYTLLLENELIYTPKAKDRKEEKFLEKIIFTEPVYVEKIFDDEEAILDIILENFDNCYHIFDDNTDVLDSIGVQCGNLFKTNPVITELINFALQCFERIIQINPIEAQAFFNLGVAYQENNELNKAIESYLQAIELNPQDAATYNNLGVLYQENNELDKAIESYLQAVEFNPQYAAAYNNLGNAYKDNNELDKAIESYLQAIEFNPQDAAVYYNLGILYQKNNELDKAIESYLQAVELNPQYAAAYNNLGLSYIIVEDYKKALEVFSKYVDLSPDDWIGYFHLARINSILENAEEAFKFLRLAKEKNPEITKFKNDSDFDFIRDLNEYNELMDN